MRFLHTLLKTTQGQSVARTAMNQSLMTFYLQGKVLDIGGARNPDYFSYFQRSDDTAVDIVDGALSSVDFEKDALPYEDGSYDTVLLCNVLEHIFNHRHLLNEAYRVTKKEGRFIGFVPFLIYVHPDPHDYFRYTEETLHRLLTETGFTDVVVTPVGKGPFLVGCNAVIQSLPKIFRPFWFVWNYALDVVFGWLSHSSTRERFPLGYTFSAKK